MRRYVLLGVIWALLCAAAIIPAQWALGLLSKSAKDNIIQGSVSGTIWQGQAKVLPPKTTWPLHINYKINPLKAILRQPFSKTILNGPGFGASGQIGVFGSQNISIQNFNASFDLPQLPISDPRFAGLSGQANVMIDALRIKGTCRQASGQLRTNILSANADSLQWTGPVLSGPISCDDEAVLAALRGRDDAYNITLDIRLYPDGVYSLDMRIDPITAAPEDFGLALGLLGFEETPNGGAQLKERGQIFQGAHNDGRR